MKVGRQRGGRETEERAWRRRRRRRRRKKQDGSRRVLEGKIYGGCLSKAIPNAEYTPAVYEIVERTFLLSLPSFANYVTSSLRDLGPISERSQGGSLSPRLTLFRTRSHSIPYREISGIRSRVEIPSRKEDQEGAYSRRGPEVSARHRETFALVSIKRSSHFGVYEKHVSPSRSPCSKISSVAQTRALRCRLAILAGAHVIFN